jgi:hypothetical protein
VIAERLADDLVFSWKFRKRTENKKQKTERDEFASPVRTRKSEAHFEFAPYLLSKVETRRDAGSDDSSFSDAPWFSCFVSARRVNRSFNPRAREGVFGLVVFRGGNRWFDRAFARFQPSV